MFLRGVISFATMKRRGRGGRHDSGAHCGVRRIQGSKSDYQLVSEARLRYSLAFTATFYFQRQTALTPRDQPQRARKHNSQTQRLETTPHNAAKVTGCQDSNAASAVKLEIESKIKDVYKCQPEATLVACSRNNFPKSRGTLTLPSFKWPTGGSFTGCKTRVYCMKPQKLTESSVKKTKKPKPRMLVGSNF